ncbi:hypothetical protein [Leucobacter iarius]|uniref:hypothetical protein n=1 Tax=Leucobacter iarius TaxID=333963 RepID=UPI0031D80620
MRDFADPKRVYSSRQISNIPRILRKKVTIVNSTLLTTDRPAEPLPAVRAVEPDRALPRRGVATPEACSGTESARLRALELREAQLAAQRARAEHETLRVGYAPSLRLF